MEIRERLGEYLNRVPLRHDEFIIQRKGKALAAMVPVEKLAELERAARQHLLESLRSRKRAPSQAEADRLADEAKHRTRGRKKARPARLRAVLYANGIISGLIRPQGPPGRGPQPAGCGRVLGDPHRNAARLPRDPGT